MVERFASSSSRRAISIAFALSMVSAVPGFAQRAAPAIPDHPLDPSVYVNPRSPADDPRTGLKGGLYDAGSAISGLQLILSVPKPGVFGPDLDSIKASEAVPPPPPPTPGSAPAPGGGRGAGGPRVNYGQTNSDLGFQGKYLFQGNYYGINIFDISDPAKMTLKTSIVCPGGQGDVSVFRNLLFMSVETAGKIDCSVPPTPAAPPPGLATAAPAAGAAAGGRRGGGAPEVADPSKARGVRIFDISDIEHPKQVAMVQTCRGSHTHSILTGTADKGYIYFYVAGSSGVRPAAELAGCVAGPDDPNTAVFTIVIVKVPLDHPENAKIVGSPYIFSDPKTGSVNGLWQGGTHGDNTETTSATRGCHDLTVFESQHYMGGACSGNGILLDISNPEKPTRLDAVTDPNFAFWHSANFSNDGKVVLFTDEWGGGGAPHCRLADPMAWGGDAIFKIVDKKLVISSYFKMPAIQEENKNCVAHNGSLIPVPGRNILVQSWYQGGMDVYDFTDPTHPYEIGYFTRGPIGKDGRRAGGGDWSSYYYNGYIYGSEMARGTDVLKLVPTKYLTQNEIDAAAQIKLPVLNVQDQPHFDYPKTYTTAKAYVDQLVRDDALTIEKAGLIDVAMDGKKTASLKTYAAELKKQASTATGIDADRLNWLAEIIEK
jgi:LVIVD repeat